MINLTSIENKIPKQVRAFLGKALLFFIIWKFLYNFFLYDSKYLDHPLTNHVGVASVWVINNLGTLNNFAAKRVVTQSTYGGVTVPNEVTEIYHNNRVVLYIANVCNGLELMVLYIGFIICMPSAFYRKLLYIVLGVIILDLCNIMRCVGLIYLQEYHKIYFDFAHHYLFNAVVYTATFIMWMLYSRKIHISK